MLRLATACLMTLLLFNAAVFAAPASADIAGDLENFDGRAGVYAVNLKTGRTFSYNENVVFPTASTSKLVVIMAVYKYLYPAATTDQQSLYDKAANAMITVSDNDSFYQLLDELDANCPTALKKVTAELGLKKTLIHDDEAYNQFSYHSVTTPAEMAKVLLAIYDGRYLGKQRSAELKNELAATIFNDEIPRYINHKVMHKVGQLDGILCDVGIIDDGKQPVLISFYTDSDRPDSYASDFIAVTAGKIYNSLRTPDSKPAVQRRPPANNREDR